MSPWVSGGGIAAGLLYLVALGLLLFGPGQLPDYTYNWEHYTAYDLFRFWDGGRPLLVTFRITDGLMTDSGESPFVVLPALVSWELTGVGLTAMRIPTAMIAALAVPLPWLFARRLVGEGVALVSAALLAVSPAFLFYGRTATTVGLSIGLALFTAHALFQVLRPDPRPRVRVAWLGAFLLMLVVDAYAYSPIRLFWPLALGAIMIELIFRWKERGWLLPVGLLVLVWLPLVLTVFRAAGLTNRPAEFNVPGAVTTYYFARGEQVFSLSKHPSEYQNLLDPTAAEREAGALQGSSTELALRLVRENARDFGNLLIDRATQPVLTDHWNPSGRLYTGQLVPGVVIGFVVLLGRAARRVEARFLLELAFAFSLPMLLTSKVHVGRLVFALPILLVIGVFGYAWAGRRGLAVLDRWWGGAEVLGPLIPVGAGLLILLVGWATWHEMGVAPTSSPEPGIVTAFAEGVDTGETPAGAAYVAGDARGEEVESLDVAAYRLKLNDTYQFVNLARGESANPADPRPPLYYGGLLDQIGPGGRLPDQCAVTYYVRSHVQTPFWEQFAAIDAACSDPPAVYVLDG